MERCPMAEAALPPPSTACALPCNPSNSAEHGLGARLWARGWGYKEERVNHRPTLIGNVTQSVVVTPRVGEGQNQFYS